MVTRAVLPAVVGAAAGLALALVVVLGWRDATRFIAEAAGATDEETPR